MKVDVPLPTTTSGAAMVEHSELCLIVRDIVKVAVDLVNAPSQREWLHWHYQPEYCHDSAGIDVCDEDRDDNPENRHQSVSEMWTATWWRDEEQKLPKDCPDRRILAIGIASDETVLTMTGDHPSHCPSHFSPPHPSHPSHHPLPTPVHPSPPFSSFGSILAQVGSCTRSMPSAITMDHGGEASEQAGHWSGSFQ